MTTFHSTPPWQLVVYLLRQCSVQSTCRRLHQTSAYIQCILAAFEDIFQVYLENERQRDPN